MNEVEVMPNRTEWSDELSMLIKFSVLKGEKFVDIQKKLNIPEGTWDAWAYRNQHGFRDLLNEWKQTRIIKLAEKVGQEILELPHINEDNQVDPRIVSIKQKEAEFIRETLAKDNYSKRNELTGKDGKDLNPVDLDIKAKADEAITKYLNDPRNTPEQKPEAN